MIHFTSDQHFGHRNICRFQPQARGHYTCMEEMNDALVNNWNDVVAKDDTVYNLGDISFVNNGRTLGFFGRLNGTIIVIRGNHDRAMDSSLWQDAKNRGLIKEVHNGYHEVALHGKNFVLNHFAQRVWNRNNRGAIHLYGHSHGHLPGLGLSVDVGVDSEEMKEFTGDYMRPYNIEEVLAYMETRAMYLPDHHEEA